MDAIRRPTICDAVRIGQPQIPCLAWCHHHTAAVQAEVDILIGRDRDMDTRHPPFGRKIMIAMLPYDRPRRQAHQPRGLQRTSEASEHLPEIGRVIERGRILEPGRSRIGVDHHDGMRRTGGHPQGNDAPASLIILPHEMVDPRVMRQSIEIFVKTNGIELEREADPIGKDGLSLTQYVRHGVLPINKWSIIIVASLSQGHGPE
jgi:hypothetical protein